MLSSSVRLISAGGGAFAITAVPDHVRADPAELSVDIEFLSPDRQVRYLARSLTTSYLVSLAEFFMRCAADPLPEQSVDTAEDASSTLALSVLESDEQNVTIQFVVVVDPEEDVADFDGVALDLRRAALVTAAHDARALHDKVVAL